MIVIPVLTPLLAAAGKEIASWTDSGSRLRVQAVSVVESALCPGCAGRSSQRHGLVWRTLADCPSFGMAVTLEVQVRRFKCANLSCKRRTFSEPIEPLAGRRQRRTWRLRRQHLLVGYALGGEAGARLAAHLGMRLSGAALLAQLRAAGCTPHAQEPQVIGIDDWALARRHRYGTIVVDLETRRPIELLAGRDAATVVGWLKERRAVEIIARDRAGAYADAARTAAPEAQQVADRWHLLANLRDAIERLLLRYPGKLKEAAQQASEALQFEAVPATAPTEPVDVAPAEPPLKASQCHSNARRQHRLTRYEEVVRRHKAGESIRAIGLAMNLDRRTIRGFLRADAFSERAQRARIPTLVGADVGMSHRADYLVSRFPRRKVQQVRSLRHRLPAH